MFTKGVLFHSQKCSGMHDKEYKHRFMYWNYSDTDLLIQI